MASKMTDDIGYVFSEMNRAAYAARVANSRRVWRLWAFRESLPNDDVIVTRAMLCEFIDEVFTLLEMEPTPENKLIVWDTIKHEEKPDG